MNLLHAVVLLSIGTISLLNFGECLALEQKNESSCTNEDPSTCGNDQIVTDTDTPEEVNADDDDDDDDNDNDCQDEHTKCSEWSRIGECDENPGYMLEYCSRSCKQCPDQAEELAAILAEKVKKVKVYTTEELMLGEDMGEPQSLEAPEFHVSEKETTARIDASRLYLQDSDFDDDLIEICLNKHEKCFAWAVAGECEKNKKYMISSCAPACMTCDKLTVESRCPIDPDAKAAWESGSLNAMFERLTSEPIITQYNVTILSSPPEPWVVIVDGVVTEEESKRFIELGDVEGFERSQDVGAKNPDGTYGSIVSTGRTSTNAWCNEKCHDDPVAVTVQKRLSYLTMINETNSEYLQLLK
jgi:hypothetical protein